MNSCDYIHKTTVSYAFNGRRDLRGSKSKYTLPVPFVDKPKERKINVHIFGKDGPKYTIHGYPCPTDSMGHPDFLEKAVLKELLEDKSFTKEQKEEFWAVSLSSPYYNDKPFSGEYLDIWVDCVVEEQWELFCKGKENMLA